MRITLSTAALLLLTGSLAAQSPYKPTTAAQKTESEQQRGRLANASWLSALPLKNVGPTIMSGRVTDIDVNPENPVEFYVAYASGGLWHTKNNGQSFTPISDNLPHTFMGDVTVNWKERIIWLGTGEPNAQRSSYAGTGVYKSEDNGKTWTSCGLPESHHIGGIALHAGNKNTALVAVTGKLYTNNKERGVFRTEDGGKTWQQTLYINDSTGAIDITSDPVNPDIVYACMWEKGRKAWNFVESGEGSGIYKSTDGGKTWRKLNTPDSGLPYGKYVGRTGIAAYEKDPSILYAVVDNQAPRKATGNNGGGVDEYAPKDLLKLTQKSFDTLDNKKLDAFIRRYRIPNETAVSVKEKVKNGTLSPTALTDFISEDKSTFTDPSPDVTGAEIFRSNDGGKTWKKTHDKYIDNAFFTYGYVFARIWISPANPDKIVTVAVPLLCSEDGGKTFRDLGKENVHVDHHAFWFDPKNDEHFINGNDGGINISYDNGATWFKANTPPLGQFYAVTTDNAVPYRIYGGMQDNGVWYGPSTYTFSYNWTADGNYPYKSIGGGDGMQVQVDPRDNNTYYTGSQFGYYYRNSLDQSVPYLGIQPGHQFGEKPLRFNWQTPIHLSVHQPDVLYLGANKVYRSLNKGANMTAISPDLTHGFVKGDVPYGTITTLHESPLKFGLLYTGSDDGRIHVSRDGGFSWTDVTGKLPARLWASRVQASAHKEGRVYATLNGYRYDHFEPYLYVSEDFGKNWTRLGKDLPLEPLNVVREDSINENVLYVGSDNGLYVSFNKGVSFHPWDNGMPRVPVHDIALQQRDKAIVVATHGRSIYTGDIAYIQQLTPEKIAGKPFMLESKQTPVAAPRVRRRFSAPTNDQLPAVAFFTKEQGPITITLVAADGKELMQVKDTAVGGINVTEVPLAIAAPVQEALHEQWKKQGNYDENRYVLPPGKYKLNIVFADGTVLVKEVEGGVGRKGR